jgi:hypothetical protein
MLNINRILYLFAFILFLIISLTVMFNDKSHWYGLENEKNDVITKLINRTYFSMNMVSTIGITNIVPKSRACKIFVSLFQLIIVIGVYEFFSAQQNNSKGILKLF